MALRLNKNIKLIISDFDGVFTDGGVYIDENGNCSKKLNFSDVMGVFLLLKAGYKLAIVSGDKSSAIEYLKKRFGIEDIYQDIRKKTEVVDILLKKYNLDTNEVLYLGDDVNDIESMKMFKYVISPKNLNFKVKELKHIQISSKNGGNGFFREIVDGLIY